MWDFLNKLFGMGGISGVLPMEPTRKRGDVFLPGMRVHIRSVDASSILQVLQEVGPLSAEHLAEHLELSAYDIQVILIPEIGKRVIFRDGLYILI